MTQTFFFEYLRITVPNSLFHNACLGLFLSFFATIQIYASQFHSVSKLKLNLTASIKPSSNILSFIKPPLPGTPFILDQICHEMAHFVSYVSFFPSQDLSAPEDRKYVQKHPSNLAHLCSCLNLVKSFLHNFTLFIFKPILQFQSEYAF